MSFRVDIKFHFHSQTYLYFQTMIKRAGGIPVFMKLKGEKGHNSCFRGLGRKIKGK
jgi:hypothetical protein